MRFNGDEIGIGTFNLKEIDDCGLYVRLKVYDGGKLIPGGYMVAHRKDDEVSHFVDFGDALEEWNRRTGFIEEAPK